MARFDPPRNHWDADFDARLNGSLEYLKNRLDADEADLRTLIVEMRGLRDEMAQMVKDCKFLLDEAGN